MKRKLLLFAGVSVAFSVTMYLGFLIFDLLSTTPREHDWWAIKFAASVAVLTSVYMIFFTRFFEKQKKS
ncbi:MAG: hypothetical protein WAL94_09210 [Bacteroidales bacterium]